VNLGSCARDLFIVDLEYPYLSLALLAHITNKAETLCATPLGPEVGPNLGLSCNQDYHRFHAPVSGKMIKVVNISGYLYTVWFHIQMFFMLNIFLCNYSRSLIYIFAL
jgi:hypothetical protein